MKEQNMWRVAGASVCGVSHEKCGQPCQDVQQTSVLADGTLMVAVADGAGSAAFADAGAATAVKAALESLSRSFTPPESSAAFLRLDDDQCKSVLNKAIAEAQKAVETEAATRNASPRDLASTLIVLLAHSGLVAAAHIGDGSVVICDKSEKIFALTVPKHGEYINETTFLVSPNALEQMQLTVWRGDLSCLAVISDGLQMQALQMPNGTPHAPFFIPLFKFLLSQPDGIQDGLLAFLRSPRLRERADDDLTLVMAALI